MSIVQTMRRWLSVYLLPSSYSSNESSGALAPTHVAAMLTQLVPNLIVSVTLILFGRATAGALLHVSQLLCDVGHWNCHVNALGTANDINPLLDTLLGVAICIIVPTAWSFIWGITEGISLLLAMSISWAVAGPTLEAVVSSAISHARSNGVATELLAVVIISACGASATSILSAIVTLPIIRFAPAKLAISLTNRPNAYGATTLAVGLADVAARMSVGIRDSMALTISLLIGTVVGGAGSYVLPVPPSGAGAAATALYFAGVVVIPTTAVVMSYAACTSYIAISKHEPKYLLARLAIAVMASAGLGVVVCCGWILCLVVLLAPLFWSILPPIPLIVAAFLWGLSRGSTHLARTQGPLALSLAPITVLLVSGAIGLSVYSWTQVGVEAALACLSFGLGYVLGWSRWLLMPITVMSFARTYAQVRADPKRAPALVKHSCLHWEECRTQVLPGLSKVLAVVAEVDPEAAQQELAFIRSSRRRQAIAIRDASLVVTFKSLQSLETLGNVAGHEAVINNLLSERDLRLTAQHRRAISLLRDYAREGVRFFGSTLYRSRSQALQDIQRILGELKRLDEQARSVFENVEVRTSFARLVLEWEQILKATQKAFDSLVARGRGNIPNPYKVNLPLDPNEPLFAGRHDVARSIEAELLKPEGKLGVLMQGERRMGKTSTIRNLSVLLGHRYIPAAYDLQTPGMTASTAHLLRYVAREIEKVLVAEGIGMAPWPEEPLSDPALTQRGAYAVVDDWLNAVDAALSNADRYLLLIFDEYEDLAAVDDADVFDLELFLRWVRSTIQNRRRIALIFSGVKSFGQAFKGEEFSRFFVQFRRVPITFLGREDALRLILSPVPGSPLDIYGIDVHLKVYAWTRGHPFLTQALCSSLIEELNDLGQLQAGEKEVDKAVKRVIGSFPDFFMDLWNRSDETQRSILRELSVQPQMRLASQELQSRLTCPDREYRSAIASLVGRDLASVEEPSISLNVPIFGIWVNTSLTAQS